MPQVSISVPHQLTQDEAVRRMKEKGEFLQSAYGSQVSNLKQEWNGNVLDYAFTVMGFNIKGQVKIEPSEANVTTELPWVAMAMKGKIESKVREEIGKLLA